MRRPKFSFGGAAKMEVSENMEGRDMIWMNVMGTHVGVRLDERTVEATAKKLRKFADDLENYLLRA